MKRLGFILIPILLMFSCGSGERTVSGPGMSDITIDLGERETSSSSTAMYAPESVSPSTTDALPSYITSIRVYITDENSEKLVDKTFDVTGEDSVQLSLDVPNGSHRTFLVYAYSSDGTLYYQGSTTADLTGASVTLSITMQYVSPSISIG